MKRRYLFILLLLALCLTACGKEPPEETFLAEMEGTVTVPATEEALPRLETAVAEVNGVPVILTTLSRGDRVDVVEVFDETHYVVKLAAGYGLVEKALVRLESIPAFESWTGYAYSGGVVYDNYRLAGEPVKKFAANAGVEVLEDLGWCLLVRYDGAEGYMKPESLAKYPAQAPEESPAPVGPEQSGNEDSTGQDGGEIALQFSGKAALLSTFTPQQGNVTGTAKVLADGTEVVLAFFDRGESLSVLAGGPEEGYYQVLLNGFSAKVSDAYIRMETEPEYTAWEGRSRGIVSLYDNFWMLGSPSDKINGGAAIRVLFELEHCYLVEAEGVTGYLARNAVAAAPASSGQTPAISGNSDPEPAAPEAVPTVPDSGSAAPGQNGGETTAPAPDAPSGGAEPNPDENSGTTVDPEWTPPKL